MTLGMECILHNPDNMFLDAGKFKIELNRSTLVRRVRYIPEQCVSSRTWTCFLLR